MAKARFGPRVDSLELGEIIRDVLGGSRFRSIANNHHVSSSLVAKTVARERALHPELAKIVPTRPQALISREQAIYRTVLQLALAAQGARQRVSAMSLKPAVDKIAQRARLGTVSLKVVSRILDRLAVESKLPARRKAGRRSTLPIETRERIAELIRANSGFSNRELMLKTSTTLNELNRLLRVLRDSGLLPPRKRPGGKPLPRRRIPTPK